MLADERGAVLGVGWCGAEDRAVVARGDQAFVPQLLVIVDEHDLLEPELRALGHALHLVDDRGRVLADRRTALARVAQHALARVGLARVAQVDLLLQERVDRVLEPGAYSRPRSRGWPEITVSVCSATGSWNAAVLRSSPRAVTPAARRRNSRRLQDALIMSALHPRLCWVR